MEKSVIFNFEDMKMKRYMQLIKEKQKTQASETKAPAQDSVISPQPQQATQQQPTVAVKSVSSLQRQLREKNAEIEKMKKAQEQLLKKQEELVQFQVNAIKEKENSMIASELQKVARKFNIKESAFEDVAALVIPKFKVAGDAIVSEIKKQSEEGKEIVESVDVETFMGSWLEGKDHYISQPPTSPSMISPVVSGQKPIAKAVPEKNTYGTQVFASTDFFGVKK